MNIFLVGAMVVNGLSGFSQHLTFEKPDYKKIEKVIQDEKSEFYYPKLLRKYVLDDSGMTLDEKRYLYFGYTFNPKYSPYGDSDFSDSLSTILNKETLSSNDYDRILVFSDSILKSNPFDVRTINSMLYVFEQRKDKESFNRNLSRMRIIMDAIMSTGDGISKKTAFYVIAPSHEYSLLMFLGFKFGGQQSLTEHYDFLKLDKNEEGIDGLYFDISPCLNHLDKMFK